MKQIPAYETNTDKTIEHAADGIAIIGMSGQFPESKQRNGIWITLSKERTVSLKCRKNAGTGQICRSR
ncbi:hypothetical protein [Bacillus subtilis]|uniref:hypothetical protein n=1 Tax=Bacillus subtilis TaxID=1423 RepID=UPI00202A03FE|nr:hypothetical protein [Bacillus subtilis]